MKIRPGLTEMFRAEGHTDRLRDMTNLIVGFRNFTNAPKNDSMF